MESDLPPAAVVTLIALTAVGYAVATAGMKLATGGLSPFAVALMVAGFGAAILAEIALLRGTNLAVIYLVIIGFETLLVLLLAAGMGDTLNLRQLAGAGLVLGGLALVAH